MSDWISSNHSKRAKHAKRVLASVCAFIAVAAAFDAAIAQIGLIAPQPKTAIAPLTDPSKAPGTSLGVPLDRAPVQYPTSFQHSLQIDSSNQTVIIRQKLSDFDVFIPQRLTLADYLKMRSEAELQRDWRDYTSLRASTPREQTGGGRGITISTPKIKSEAFRRVFGGETLSLNVTGNITLNGEMRNEKRSQMKTAVDRAPNTNFQMKQTQNFKVTGKIGENVSVDVDQDSERMFDFENAIHLKYSSEEDGIIQSIEAGNVALSLPATRFVTFSAQNSGLFGIKSQMKIGGLDVTAIASMEKGEKKKLSLSGGKEDNVQQIYDYDYKRNTYFFLDSVYRGNFVEITPGGLHVMDERRIVTDLEVYKSDANYMNQMGTIRAWALFDPNKRDTLMSDQMHYKGYFMRMEPNKDYDYNKELGYIAMNIQLNESEVLAVAYRDSSRNELGTRLALVQDTASVPIYLKLIKPRNPRPMDPTWDLEWKNVYSIGSRDMNDDGFELKLFRKTPSGDPEQAYKYQDGVKSYLDIFGLDRLDKNGTPNKPDGVIDRNDNFLRLNRGELIFPDIRPFNPVNKNYDIPDEYKTTALYDTLDQAFVRKESKFYMEVKSSSRSANFSLGMNVIENSEEVFLNGSKLVRDKDYIIEYTSGSLTMLRDDARNPSAKLEVNYESQQMISIDKKSLLGLRAEYRFREDAAQPSFIGATLLYMNQKTMDQRIRLGQQGPMKNLVWDVNTSFNFQPNILTKALDALPLIQATAPSNFTFEGEIAQVIPNPNTLNNEATGDRNGVAYLDDFEGSKREVTLGVIRNGWTPSSLPGSYRTRAEMQDLLRYRGHLTWYNPYSQVQIQEIWPKREVTTNYGGSTLTHVLDLVFFPNPDLDQNRSWGGIMRYLSAGYADQTNSRFLEIMVQGDVGVLHVDLGQISEDAIPNEKLDTEDKIRGGIRNNLLEDDEDTGLDGVFGSDPNPDSLFIPHRPAHIDRSNPERPTATPYDFWDVDGDNDKDEWEPWSYDNWSYQAGIADYRRINGTEGSRNDGALIYPNSEDLNANGDVDLNNDYFEYSINLDKNPSNPDIRYIKGNEDNEHGWRLYRIPLNEWRKKEGQPQWSRIEYARIWIDSVIQSSARVSIADITLSGNEWKFQGIADSDSGQFSTSKETEKMVEVAVINTHDNPEYVPPPGVEGVVDPIQKIRSKEQALLLDMKGLPPKTTAIAQKQFYQPEDLIHYKTLKMFVHGGDYTNNFPEDTSIVFFLRWGSDTENKNYYEVRFPVYKGWDPANNIELEFELLSQLKVQAQIQDVHSDTTIIRNNQQIILVGKPSLTNIRWLIVGIKNNGNAPFVGQIWLDELRLSNVRKEKGMAMRARADFKLSDFFSLNGEYNRKDADFHTVNERFGEGSNTRSGNLNASIQLHKFLPASWGFAIPVTTTFAQNLSTPKYIPGTDILLNKNNPLLTRYQNISKQNGVSVSLSKSSKSRNVFTRILLDPVSGSFNFAQSDMSNSMTEYAKTISSSGSFRYRLTPSNQNYIQPFQWLGKKGFLKTIALSKFNYLPTSLSYDLTGNKSNANSKTREGVLTSDTTATLTRNFDTGFQPFQILSVDFSKSASSDMRFTPNWGVIFTDLDPGLPTEKNQNFTVKLNPKIFSWLTHNASYSANYRWSSNPQLKNQGTGTNASITSSMTLSGSFDPGKMMQGLFKKKPTAKTPQIRQPILPQSPKKEDAKNEAAKPETGKKGESKPFILTSVLSGFGGVFKKIDPISINITESTSSNDYGILDTPDLSYQLGFSMDPKVRFSPNLTSNRSSQRNDSRLTLRSGIKITSNLTSGFDFSFSDNKNMSTQTTRTVTQSALILKDKGIPFPGWNLQWRGMEKLKFISKFTKSLSLTHTFSGQQVDTYNDNRLSNTQISKNFRPLLGVALTMKNGITGNIQYTSTVSLTNKTDKAYGIGKTKQVSNSFTVSASYSKRGGIRIPFLKNKKLDNTLDFKLAFEKSLNVTYQINKLDAAFQADNKTQEAKNWSIEPRVDYSFSSTVQGGCYFKIGQRQDLRMGKTRITAFGVNANISLAGR
jgi:cell surface protein SprA